jgi:hypothetical protein
MRQNSESNPQSEGINLYQSQPKDEITPSDRTSSDLDDISQSIVERIKKSQEFQEIEKLVSVLSSLEDLKEKRTKQKKIKQQAQEFKNEIKFRRKIEITEIVTKKVFSAFGVCIGVYLISDAPLLAPVLIITGLSGVLDFKLKDRSELLSNTDNNPPDLSVDEVIHESTKSPNNYYEFRQDRIRIGFFLLICSYSLILGLIFVLQNLAIQQALIAIATLLILAALEVFKNPREKIRIYNSIEKKESVVETDK